MSDITTRLELPYPIGTDSPPDVPEYMQNLAEALDTVAVDRQGVASAKPAANTVPYGTYYFETDTGLCVRSDGSAWEKLVPENAAAGTPSLRKLGTGATDAAAGNDARLFDQRVPTDNSVTAAKIANDAVGATEIAAGAVGSSEIGANAVGSDEIAAGAVGVSELAAAAATAAKLGLQSVGILTIGALTLGVTDAPATDAGTQLLETDPAYVDVVAATSRISVAADGLYLFLFQADLFSNATFSYASATIWVSGAHSSVIAEIDAAQPAAGIWSVSRTLILDLIATDYVQMGGKMTSGGAVKTLGGSIHALYLGPPS